MREERSRAQRITYIKGAAQVATVAGASEAPKRGAAMADAGILENAGIVVEGDRIAFVGPDAEARRYVAERGGADVVIDAAGKVVTPGLVDPHTHLVFAGYREVEWARRLHGTPYLEILREGGGILETVRRTRAASEEELVEAAKRRLDRFLLHGVTTVEAKSGYGLTVEDELKQLRAVRRLHEAHPVDVVATFLGAHAVPPEYRHDPDAYVALVVDAMLPRVADAGLAEFCDVFCEEGVFTVAQARRILEAAKRWGLKPKLHADEMHPCGGAELAAEVRAVSADHLLKASPAGVARMAEAGVVAVLLPGTAFFLREKPADARAIIAAGVPVALATDCNPGSSPTVALPLIMSLACLTMGLTPEEALVASTINAAHAVGRAHEIGSIEVGKKADLVVFDAPNVAHIPYQYGVNLVDTVLKNGAVVVEGGVRHG